MKPLLVVDGDSLAHRAYHAMPKSIRLNGVLGFSNMLLRLWEAEEPRAVLVGWDTYEIPTYRHKAFAPYQSGRVFEESLLEQLPPREKKILLLRFFGNMTQSQIAAELGISQMHVSRLLARTLTQLRDGLTTEE